MTFIPHFPPLLFLGHLCTPFPTLEPETSLTHGMTHTHPPDPHGAETSYKTATCTDPYSMAVFQRDVNTISHFDSYFGSKESIDPKTKSVGVASTTGLARQAFRLPVTRFLCQ